MARTRGVKSGCGGKMAGQKKRLLTNKFQDFLEDSLPSEELHNRNTDIVSPVFKPSYSDVYGDQSHSYKKPPRPNVFHTGSKGYVQPISRHHFQQFLAQAVTHSNEKMPFSASHMGFDSVEATSPIVEPTCTDPNSVKTLSKVMSASPDLKERREDRALIPSQDCPNTMIMDNSVMEEIPAFHSDYACDQCNWILISPRQLQKHQEQSHSGINYTISSLLDTNVLSSKPQTVSSEAQKMRKDVSYSTPPKATNATNPSPTNVTPTINATIIVSDDDEAELNTTICLSDDDETHTPRKVGSAKRKLVAKRLFTNYPPKQNKIKDGGFENNQGISYTRMNSGEESNKCFKEAIHKINKLGSGISLSRMSDS